MRNFIFDVDFYDALMESRKELISQEEIETCSLIDENGNVL